MKESLPPAPRESPQPKLSPSARSGGTLGYMKTPLSVATLISIALLAPISGHAENTVWLPNVIDSPTRFSAPGIYTGAPDRTLTLSMILAGGGPEHFAAVPLVKILAGSKSDAEITALKEKFGDQAVQTFVTILPFAVDDFAANRQAERHRATINPQSQPEGWRSPCWRGLGRRPDWPQLQCRGNV